MRAVVDVRVRTRSRPRSAPATTTPRGVEDLARAAESRRRRAAHRPLPHARRGLLRRGRLDAASRGRCAPSRSRSAGTAASVRTRDLARMRARPARASPWSAAARSRTRGSSPAGGSSRAEAARFLLDYADAMRERGGLEPRGVAARLKQLLRHWTAGGLVPDPAARAELLRERDGGALLARLQGAAQSRSCSLDRVSISFGPQALLDGASLQVDAGERVCLIGRNGAGKSTLLKIVSGEVAPDAGAVWRMPGLTHRDGSRRICPSTTRPPSSTSSPEGLAELGATARGVPPRVARGRRDDPSQLARMDALQHELEALRRLEPDRSGSTRSSRGSSCRPTRRSARSRAAGAAASRSRRRSSASPTCCCSTSPPTTSTSR